MPKKTRQEKILAQLKRLQQRQTQPTQPDTTTQENPSKIEVSTGLKSLEPKNNVVSAGETSKELDYSYAYKDLRKTLFFVSIAIIFEIILSRVI